MPQLSLFESSDLQSSWKQLPFLVIDTETTGLNPQQNRIIEVAWVLFKNQHETLAEARFCSIPDEIPSEITRITGIRREDLENQDSFEKHIQDLVSAASEAAFIVAYNASFDRSFIEAEFAHVKYKIPDWIWVDPCVYIRELDRYQKGKKLMDAALRWGVSLDRAHRALSDARAAGNLLIKLMPKLPSSPLSELISLQKQWQKKQEQEYQAYRNRHKSF